MILFLKSSTLGVIGVGSPEDGRERGRSAAAPGAVPGRRRTPIAASGQSVDSAGVAHPKCRGMARGWLRGARLVENAGSENCQSPPPVGRRWTSGGRRGRIGAQNRRDGREFHTVSRRVATTSGFANLLPASRQHLYALYFLIRWTF